jgi:molybdopterin/thiamine biosynthesis adenylyltransferase
LNLPKLDVSRNWGVISEETQKKIENSVVFSAGCGLGGLAVTFAARVGFRKFILADGDIVTPDNLNRQPFFVKHLGRNKASATAEIITEINPEAEIKIYPKFLEGNEEIFHLIKESNFVINTVDPNEAFWEIHEIARKLRRVELHPLNAGWWSFVYVSLPDSPSLDEVLGRRVYGYELYQRLVSLAPQVDLPLEILKKMEKIVRGELPFPQIATTSAVTAAIAVNVMIEWLEKGRLEKNPIVVKAL